MKLIERKEIFETHKNSASLIKDFQKLSILIILIILNNSCNQKDSNILETKTFEDGQKAISYGENGIVDSIVIEKKGVKFSKFITKSKSKKGDIFKVNFYDGEGNINASGEMQDNQKVGIWFYFKEKKVVKKEEYLTICNKNILNQVWSYKSNDIVDYDKSSFYTFKFKDTVFDDEKVEVLKIRFNSDKNIKVNNLKFYASRKLTNDFCNIHDLNLIDIPRNSKNEYELAINVHDKINVIKGFFIEEIKIDNKIKEKYTFVKIPRN